MSFESQLCSYLRINLHCNCENKVKIHTYVSIYFSGGVTH